MTEKTILTLCIEGGDPLGRDGLTTLYNQSYHDRLPKWATGRALTSLFTVDQLLCSTR